MEPPAMWVLPFCCTSWKKAIPNKAMRGSDMRFSCTGTLSWSDLYQYFAVIMHFMRWFLLNQDIYNVSRYPIVHTVYILGDWCTVWEMQDSLPQCSMKEGSNLCGIINPRCAGWWPLQAGGGIARFLAVTILLSRWSSKKCALTDLTNSG